MRTLRCWESVATTPALKLHGVKRGVMYVERSRDAKVLRVESEADLHRTLGPVVASGMAALTPISQDRRQERSSRLNGSSNSADAMDSSGIV